MSSFKSLNPMDNFYQSASYFPMPTIMISTLDENGRTSVGSYSLCFPFYIAGRDFYAMILNCRNTSNTAQHILKTKKAALNFITDDSKFFTEAVRLGFPGESSEEKMKDFALTLEDGQASEIFHDIRPKVIKEAYQVFECTWADELENAYEDCAKVGMMDGIDPPYRNFNGITSRMGAHFVLKIDKILLKDKQYEGIMNGVTRSSFPRVPVDYGYRDSKNFWYTKFSKPRSENIPDDKAVNLDSIRYAVTRIDSKGVTFTDDAMKKMTKIPRIFLKTAVGGMIDYCVSHNIKVCDEKIMDEIQNARKKQK